MPLFSPAVMGYPRPGGFRPIPLWPVGPMGVVLALLIVAGCTDDPPPLVIEHRIWDSAGVEIIETGTPLHADERGWEIYPEPILEIGRVDGSAPYLLSRIWDAVLLEDGRIILSEANEPHVRIFGADGSHITSFGTSGEGPTDFGAPPMLALVSPDTLLVWDPHFYRLSRYELGGSLLDQRSLSSQIRGDHALPHIFGTRVWEVRGDGLLLWTGSLSTPMPVEGHYTLDRDPTVFGPDGTLVVRPAPLPMRQAFGFRVGDGSLRNVFNPFTHTGTGILGTDHSLVSVPTERAEIHYLDESGEVVRILRAPAPRSPVTRSMVVDAREEVVEAADNWGGYRVTPAEIRAAFDALPIPDSLPAFRRLFTDPSGDLWAERQMDRIGAESSEVILDVFRARDGRWLSTVRAPDEIRRILAIGSGAVLIEHLDDLDVPRLRLYPIVRPSDPEAEPVARRP